MRHNFFGLLAFIIATPLSSQEITVHSNEFLTRVVDIEHISENEYILATVTNEENEWYGHGKIDWIKDGEVIREIDLPYYCLDLQINNIDEKLILDVAEFGECDVFGGNLHSYSLDTISQDTLYPNYYASRWLPVTGSQGVRRIQDSILVNLRVWHTNNKLAVTLDYYNEALQLLQSDTLENESLEQLHQYNDKIYFYGGNVVAARQNMESPIIYYQFENEDFKDLAFADSFWMALSSKQVHLFNHDEELISSIPIDTADFTPKEIAYLPKTENAGIYVLGHNRLGEAILLRYTEGDWDIIEGISHPDIAVSDILSFNDSELWILGHVKVLNVDDIILKQNMTIQTLDVPLLEDQISLEILDYAYIGEENYVVSASVKYRLQNLTINPLKDIYVYSTNIHSAGFCPGKHYENNVNLEALEVRVVTDTVMGYSLTYFGTNMCLFTSGANRSLDGNLENNRSCRYEISNIDHVKKEKINIYPNPVYDQLLVEGLRTSGKYQISTISGQVVASGDITKVIDVNSLDKGIYILSFIASGETTATKFIKL